MSSSQTTAPPSPLPWRVTDSSGIDAPHAALSRPVETGAPGCIPAGAVIVPVTEASVAVESTTYRAEGTAITTSRGGFGPSMLPAAFGESARVVVGGPSVA